MGSNGAGRVFDSPTLCFVRRSVTVVALARLSGDLVLWRMDERVAQPTLNALVVVKDLLTAGADFDGILVLRLLEYRRSAYSLPAGLVEVDFDLRFIRATRTTPGAGGDNTVVTGEVRRRTTTNRTLSDRVDHG